MKPLISIIIPAYNAAPYIAECLEQLKKQTFHNYELLMIDDGSTDDTAIVMKRYQIEDDRIRFIRKENGGVSSARNLGLDNAVGDWIAFIDADDTINDNYLTNLVKHVSDNVDIIIGGFCSFGTTNGISIRLKNGTYSMSELGKCLSEYMKSMTFGTSWGKLYRREIIEKGEIRFNERIRFNEDSLFNQNFFLSMNKALLMVENQDYHWRISSNTLKYGANGYEVSYTIHQLINTYSLLSLKYKFQNKEYVNGVFEAHMIRLMTHNCKEKKQNKSTFIEIRDFVNSFKDNTIFCDDQTRTTVSVLYKLVRHRMSFVLYVFLRYIYPIVYSFNNKS